MIKAFYSGLDGALAKLERRSPFSSAARAAFLALKYDRRTYTAHQDIIREGDETTRCRFLERGTLSRSKMLPGGGRQIVSFHIAGDLVDLQGALLLISDHTIRSHEPSVVLSIADRDILYLAQDFSEIGRAFWFDTLVDASVFREWNLNLGRRNGRERTAHLLMEIGYRLQEAQLEDRCDFPMVLTQVDLADALGLTPVHMNRTLQWLRTEGLIRTTDRRVIIPDWSALAEFAVFRPLYLHPEGPRPLAA